MNITTFIDEAIHDICTGEPCDYGLRRVKTRKAHNCAFCGREIPVGESARFYEGRYPRYDGNEAQIGIEYIRDWMCADYGACIGRGIAFFGRSVSSPRLVGTVTGPERPRGAIFVFFQERRSRVKGLDGLADR